MPLYISVVIPAYKAEPFIRETLDCVQNQERQPDEIIVVVDGSPDRTTQRVREWAAQNRPDLILLEQPNRGASAARNNGIRHATCELIAPVDADDAVLPNHLSLLESAFHAVPDLVMAFGDATTFDRTTLNRDSFLEGSRIAALDYDERPDGLRVIRGSAYGGIVGGSRVATPASLFRRQAAIDAGLYNETLPQGNDVEFLLRLSRVGTFAYHFVPVVRVRRHENNLTHRRHRIRNRQCKVNLYRQLLSRQEELSLSREEVELTSEALSAAVRSLMKNASQQGLASLISQYRWTIANAGGRSRLTFRDVLRAVKHTFPTPSTR